MTNAQRVILHVENVNDCGLTEGNVPIGFLLGDTSSDTVVNSRDISGTRSQLGHLVTGENFRFDVTADGNLDLADVRLVNPRTVRPCRR